MSNIVIIEERFNYGVAAYYVTSEHAQAIRALTGKKTVSASDVNALESLGLRVRMAGRPEMPAIEAMSI